MLSCDWCEEPIVGKGRAYKMTLETFSILDLNRKTDTPDIAGELHFHAEPCRERFLSAARELAREHIPLEDEIEHERGESLEEEHAEKPTRTSEWMPQHRRHERWGELPGYERDRLVLELFDGTAWLTNPEVVERLENEDKPCPYPGAIGAVTRQLAKDGELVKEAGQWGKCRIRYRRSEPSAEVKDLQRQLEKEES